MASKLLSYASVLLLFATFSFTAEDRFSSNTGLSTTLLFARVIPLAIVVVFCFLAVPVKRYLSLIKTASMPPVLFWTWYAAVAMVSGSVNPEIPLLWSTWKCVEIFVVSLWAASLFIHMRATGSAVAIRRVFTNLVIGCYFVCLWSITEMLREGHSIGSFITGGYRLETHWPHINSISLSVISMFSICGGILLTSRMRFPRRVLLFLPPMIVFVLSRSRTGILGMLVLAGSSLLNSTVNKGKKLALILLAFGFIGVLISSSTMREWMRVDSLEELARGAGRITAEDGKRSGWGDTARLVKKSPAIGYGFVIVRRFMDNEHAAVDNFVLQAMVVGGAIGAVPMVAFAFFSFFRWFLRQRTQTLESRKLAEMGLTAMCFGFVKSLTTNGISTYDISLLLFLVGAVAQQAVIQPKILNPDVEQ